MKIDEDSSDIPVYFFSYMKLFCKPLRTKFELVM